MLSSGNSIIGFMKKEVGDCFEEAALKILEYFNTDKILQSSSTVPYKRKEGREGRKGRKDSYDIYYF